jgi:hypothetical protein
VSTAGGSRACWSADGLPAPFFRGPAGNLVSATGVSKTPELLAVDKGRFLFNVAQDDGRESAIRVVVNWERMLTTAR